MRNFAKSLMLFTITMAAIGTEGLKRWGNSPYYTPYHGGSGHGSSGRSRNVMSKAQMARRRKEKAARKARRKRR